MVVELGWTVSHFILVHGSYFLKMHSAQTLTANRPAMFLWQRISNVMVTDHLKNVLEIQVFVLCLLLYPPPCLSDYGFWVQHEVMDQLFK